MEVGNGKSPAPRGEQIVELVNLTEIRRRWGLGEIAIYNAVARGEIRAYGRPGRQKYYSAAEIQNLVDSWSSSVSGRQLRFSELDDAELTA